jgi:hypothetical protein
VDTFSVVPPGICAAIGGLYGDRHLSLLVLDKELEIRAPYHLKQRDHNTYLLSTVQRLNGELKAVTLIAFLNLSDAVAAAGSGHVSRTKRGSGGRTGS